MPVSVEIDGNSVVIQRGSLAIEERIEERSTALFIVADTEGIANYVRGMPVEIFDDTPTLIFAGFIDTPGRGRLGVESKLLHDITCMDNHYLADKRLVIKSYTDKTLEFIVEDILTDYLIAEGITEGEIQTGPIIKSAIFNYVGVSEAFDALKELSGFTWFIDKDKKLYFIDRTTNAAPWDLDGSTYRAIKGSVHLDTGNPLYRNRQYVRGGKGLTSLQTENRDGDGIAQSFAMGYPLALEPTITEDAAPMTVGIKGLETGKDYYWSKGDNVIYANAAPGIGVDVECQYYGEYPLIARSDSHAGILARQAIEGGTGIVEEIVTEAQHESADAMRESAKAKIIQYCQDAEKFVYQTRDSGLSPGQLQAITYSPFGFTAHDMLIESISVTAFGDSIFYKVSCITGPVMGSWARFFSNLLTRQDKQIKIGEGLLLVLLLQSENLALVETTDLHSDAFPPDVYRWIALPPTQSVGHHIAHEALELEEDEDIEHVDPTGYVWGDGGLVDNKAEYPYTYPFEYYYKIAVWDFFSWGEGLFDFEEGLFPVKILRPPVPVIGVSVAESHSGGGHVAEEALTIPEPVIEVTAEVV